MTNVKELIDEYNSILREIFAQQDELRKTNPNHELLDMVDPELFGCQVSEKYTNKYDNHGVKDENDPMGINGFRKYRDDLVAAINSGK